MRAELPLLTKGDYLEGLRCQKGLFLRKYHRELANPVDAGSQSRMADGREIGNLARMLFPGGILIDSNGKDALVATEIMMRDAHTLFEAQFMSAGRLVRADVLQRDGDGWRLLEVKSSKEPKAKEKFKEEHLNDLAFQVLVLREAGVNVTSASLILLSRSYRTSRECGFELRKLFAIHDVTSQVETFLVDTQFRSIAMLQVLGRDEAPEIETNAFCKGCSFYEHCHVGQSEDDLVFLPRIQSDQVSEMRGKAYAQSCRFQKTTN